MYPSHCSIDMPFSLTSESAFFKPKSKLPEAKVVPFIDAPNVIACAPGVRATSDFFPLTFCTVPSTSIDISPSIAKPILNLLYSARSTKV